MKKMHAIIPQMRGYTTRVSRISHPARLKSPVTAQDANLSVRFPDVEQEREPGLTRGGELLEDLAEVSNHREAKAILNPDAMVQSHPVRAVKHDSPDFGISFGNNPTRGNEEPVAVFRLRFSKRPADHESFCNIFFKLMPERGFLLAS